MAIARILTARVANKAAVITNHGAAGTRQRVIIGVGSIRLRPNQTQRQQEDETPNGHDQTPGDVVSAGTAESNPRLMASLATLFPHRLLEKEAFNSDAPGSRLIVIVVIVTSWR